MEHDGSEDGLTPNEQLVQVLETTALSEAWRVKWRGYLVFGLVILWQLVTGPIGQVALCLATAAVMYWILAVGDLMAAHWLGYLAKEHARFSPSESAVGNAVESLAQVQGALDALILLRLESDRPQAAQCEISAEQQESD